ncbi:PREDICTED: protein SRG1 [Tarenaya hassleriana]|uniref:protein SRG1 n=1 Tax=Tarenaya hassleriana TaxID=28532 RepID=UPI00053C83E7|nr:PREDICTED: protein SRG1 [Tarenaya hassleriana]
MAPAPLSPIKVGHIEDVQELQKSKPNKVPERFIREGNERPAFVISQESASSDIPVIDLSNFSSPGLDDFLSETLRLSHACEEWGFFQVINHGIEMEVIEEMEKAAKEFFGMPLEEKQKYPMEPGTVQGYGQAFIFSEDQKLDWCNMFALGLHPPSIRNPKLWPTKPVRFSEALEKYSREVRKLCEGLLRNIARSLGVKEGRFEEIFGEAVQAVRMNYYPPCSRPDLVLGLSPHSDGSALTVLQQSRDSCVGLQILKDSMWVPFQPLPNALVINVGDTIEVLTNGKYKSVEHRAVTHRERDRMTIVTFYAPSYEVEVGPMAEFVDDETNPCKYRRYNHGEYSHHYVSNKLQGKKSLDFAKISTI